MQLSKIFAWVEARWNGPVGFMFNLFKGRSTFFALFFTGVGTYLELKHHLSMNFVALATAIQGFVVGHSWKQDAYAPRRQDVTVNVDAKDAV